MITELQAIRRAAKIAKRYGITIKYEYKPAPCTLSYRKGDWFIILSSDDPEDMKPKLGKMDRPLSLLHEIGHWVQLRKIATSEGVDGVARFYRFNELACESYASRWALRAAKLIGYTGNPEYLRRCYDTYKSRSMFITFRHRPTIALYNMVAKYSPEA